MFRAIRIGLLLLVLFFVAVSTWLTQARSTDWNNSLWVKIYPINGDGSPASRKYIESLRVETFQGIETFVARETKKYGHALRRPVRIELGSPVRQQPPSLGPAPSLVGVMFWSLKMRWWASRAAGKQDDPAPDVRIFVRYHRPRTDFVLEDSVGLQKGMVGVVNAFAGRRQAGTNNVIIAHEFLHTLGATDKYNPTNGQPDIPSGIAEPDRKPQLPQRFAEIMGGRIAVSESQATVPNNLKSVVIGADTAQEIRLLK
ncbi:MAG: hypothetical protein ACE5FV_10975 [Woeseia sp.]